MSAITAFAQCGQCCGEKAGGTNAACSAAAGTNMPACCKAKELYACTMCKTVSLQPAKCPKCGMDMTKANVLAKKDGVATLCPCAAGCQCTLKEGDPTKCSCGKDVVTVNCKAACKAATDKAAAEAK